MSIETFEYYFIPVLKVLQMNGTMHRSDVFSAVAKLVNVSDADLAVKTNKGTEVFKSRVHWATAFLAQAGAIRRPRRGYMEITDRGLELLEDKPEGFKEEYFRKYPDYENAWGGKSATNHTKPEARKELENESTPQEKIESAIDQLEVTVASELVTRVRDMSPKFLELTVLKLLQAMGYGVSDSSIEHLGGPGDDGVDGVINQDTLGLQRLYVQAKRYKLENTIGRPDIQRFIGSLSGLGANGGVFITTSRFSNEAREYSNRHLSTRIILIDGEELGRLMVRYGIGTHTRRTYQVVDIDEDFFEDN